MVTFLKKLERFEDAIQDFGKVIEINPNDEVAYYHQVNIFILKISKVLLTTNREIIRKQ